MERTPTPNINAAEKAKAILDIIMYSLATNTTMQMLDVQDLYEDLLDTNSDTLLQKAKEVETALEKLPQEQRIALNLRASQEILGNSPFSTNDTN